MARPGHGVGGEVNGQVGFRLPLGGRAGRAANPRWSRPAEPQVEPAEPPTLGGRAGRAEAKTSRDARPGSRHGLADAPARPPCRRRRLDHRTTVTPARPPRGVGSGWVSRCRGGGRTTGSARTAPAAHHEVGQGDVVLVVAQLRAVDARAEQACGAGDGDRGGVVPLVLSAGVHVGVGDVAHDRDHLDPRRAHRHQLGVDLVGERRDEGGRPGARDRDPGPVAGARRDDRRRAGVEGARRAPAAPPRRRSGRRPPTGPRARPSRRAAARRTRGCRRAGR